MNNAILIEIFGFKTVPYKNKKTGEAEKMVIYQALLREGDQPQICELMLPKDHPELSPGKYFGQFTASVDFESKRLVGRLTKLVPASSVAPPVNAKAAA